jgi:DNA polymerase-3 subunit beta
MKIIFNRQKILNEITPLMCAVSGKATLSAIEGILIEATKPDTCTMTTYDLEKGVRITVEATVLEEGTYIINAQKFFQTMKVMNSEEITLTVDQKLSVCIESGKSSYKMSALPASDFPQIPTLKSQLGFSLRQSVLKEMFSQTMYAMGVNDQRLILNGTYLRVTDEKIMLVTCDSFKLAKCIRTTDIGNENRDHEDVSFLFIIPNKTVNELYKLLGSDDEDAIVKIYYMRKYIIIELNGIIFFSRLVEGEYIDFNRIIIKNHTVKISMDKDELLSALERAALVTEERIAGNTRSHVKLDINGHILAISANSAIGSTYDEVEIVHEGGDMFIAFNNKYLIDSIRACRADRLTISLSSALTSINIEPEQNEEGSEDIFMLLPVRMKDQI